MLGLADTIVLDPDVQVTELPARATTDWSPGSAVRRGTLLVHGGIEAAAVVPPLRGLPEFVEALRAGAAVADFLDEDEVGTTSVTWQFLQNLVARGFAHVAAPADVADRERLDGLRRRWREVCAHARRTLAFAMEQGASTIVEQVAAASPPPALELRIGPTSSELAELGALARQRRENALRAHTISVELPADLPFSRELARSLRDLGARARLALELPQFASSPLVAELVREHVAVYVRLAIGRELVDHDAVAAIADAVTRARISGIELTLDWAALAEASTTAEIVLEQLARLADLVGDVRVAGLPTDDEIIQTALVGDAPPRSELERAVRVLHLQQRAVYLVELEGKQVWGQDPAGEELWVPIQQDPLPNQPGRLGCKNGGVLVDVGGGFGRVARRLAPQVGPDGLVISIEKEAVTSDRARRFACELGVPTIQFRVGLGQRLPLADESADAAVMEWGGEIHRDGLIAACVAEMKRVLRPGGRIAVTYRLVNVVLERLSEVAAPYPKIYPTMLEAVAQPGLEVVSEIFWGVKPLIARAPMAAFEERYVPRLVDELRDRRYPEQPASVDLMLTVIAQKVR